MGLMQDVRSAARALAASPGFTVVALVILGLAIGANAAIFHMIDALLLQELPVREPSRLARLDEPGFSYPTYLDLESHLSGAQAGAVFSGILAVTRQPVRARFDEQSEPLVAATVSGNFFSVLGVTAARGRGIVPEDEVSGADPAVAVLSYDLWQRRFGAQPDAIGRRIELNRVPHTIIGVAPPGFDGPFIGSPTALYVPLASYPLLNHTESSDWRTGHGWQWLHILGRLAPGVTLEHANAAVKTIWPRIHTGQDAARQVHLADGSGGISALRRQYSQPLKVLFGATGLILLLACANLANLLFARMTARAPEVAVRVSLGASRLRLFRGYFLETLLLCAAGIAAGWFVSVWVINVVSAFLSGPGSPVRLNVEVNWRTTAFSAAACLVTALMFGLGPALRASREDPAGLLQGHTRTVGDRSGWLGKALVIAQISIAACLLVGAGLLVQTLYRLTNQPAGFRPENVLHVDLNLIEADYHKTAMLDFYRRLHERIAALPGVEAAGVVWKHPISGGGWTSAYRYSGGPAERPDNAPNTHVNVTGPDYFAAIGARVLNGREFTWSDSAASPPVVIVNETFARTHWPNSNAVGQWVHLDGTGPQPYEVVGVVESFKYRNYYLPAPPTVFFAFQQMPDSIMNFPLSLEVRTKSPGQTAGSIRRIVAELDSRLPVEVEPLVSRFKRTVMRERLLAWLSAILGLLASLITATGLSGVVAFQLRRRTNELGLRLALGATPEQLIAAVMRDGLRFLAFGLAGGLVLAYITSGFLATLLFGIERHDVATYAGVALLLMGMTLVACWVPAWKIVRAAPATALRYQ